MLFERIYFISILFFVVIVFLRVLKSDFEYKTWINAEIKPLRRIGIVILLFPSLINSFNSFLTISISTIIGTMIIGMGLTYIALNLRKWYFSLNGFVSSEKSLSEIEEILDQKQVEYEKQKKESYLSRNSLVILNLNNIKIMYMNGEAYLKVRRRKNKEDIYRFIDMLERD